MTTVSEEARRLRGIAAAAFHDHVLPAMRRHLPDAADKVTVIVTSSVATGTADAASDLDAFMVFRTEVDYRRYAAPLLDLLDRLDLGSVYGEVCDKGVRFEVESLPRSDLARFYRRPHGRDGWPQQTEWLLRWFAESIPLHDPQGVHARMASLARDRPEGVRKARQLDVQTRIVASTCRALHGLRSSGLTFPSLRAACHAATAGLEGAYLAADELTPHPKWMEARARALLGGDDLSAKAVAEFEKLAGVLVQGSADSTVADALVEHDAAQRRHLSENVLGWEEGLGAWADRFDSPAGSVWVGRDLLAPEAFHAAARTASRCGEQVLTAGETGAESMASGRSGYDTVMRVSDGLRWLAGQVVPGPGAVELRRWLYLNFVVWRKLRVCPKADRRGVPFTGLWYRCQVVEHLAQARARLAGVYCPPVACWNPQTMAFLDPSMRDVCTGAKGVALVRDPGAFDAWGWREYQRLQGDMVRQGLISEQAAADPLATQWETRYWKYEHLHM